MAAEASEMGRTVLGAEDETISDLLVETAARADADGRGILCVRPGGEVLPQAEDLVAGVGLRVGLWY